MYSARAQLPHETMDNFITRLQLFSVSFEYPPDQMNDIIKDQVIERCKSQRLKVRLLPREEDYMMARLHEAVETQAKQIESWRSIKPTVSQQDLYTRCQYRKKRRQDQAHLAKEGHQVTRLAEEGQRVILTT